MKLKNKIAIVTGGSKGIGAAICEAYAKEGAQVIVVNKNDPAAGIAVAEKIKQAGFQAEAMQCDVADEAAVTALVQQILNKYGRIDILVNNAGLAVFKPLEEQTLGDWNFVMDTNLKSAFLMSRAVVPIMKKQKYGKIIFIASIAATVGFATVVPYSATKGGLLAMAKSMVAELSTFNINVNTISPGTVDTPGNQTFLSDPEFLKVLAARTASGTAMQPQDIADAAVFLASDDAKAIHGLNLIVDNARCTL